MTHRGEICDRHELHNLAHDPQYTKVMKELSALLHRHHPHPVTGGKASPDTKARFCD